MYIGRFLIAAPGIGAYRVSSRSFPNRKIVDNDGRLTVIPTEEASKTDNPYVSYNCARVIGDQSVIGNGSHVDPIAEKLGLGYPARDSLITGLHALDYEKDDYNTPRIAAIITDNTAHVGIVRKDALLVEEVELPTLVATYERDRPGTYPFEAETASEAATEAFDADFEHAVCAAGVSITEKGFEWAIENDG